MPWELKIGEVARRAGVSVETVRHYERRGLLPAPRRSHTGYRLYDPGAAERLRFIRTARELDFSLDEINAIFTRSARGQVPCGCVRELLANKLSRLDRRLDELIRLRDELWEFVERLSHRPDQTTAEDDVCGLIGGIGVPPARSLEKSPSQSVAALPRSRKKRQGGKV